MSKNPWFKWYPSDWRGDSLLRACEPMSRYVWMEMIGLMHEAEPYGHLILGGRAMDYETLSRVIGVDVQVVKRAVKELESRGVFSRTDKGVIFSRRMIRDEERAKKARENGGKGGNPSLTKQEVTPALVIQADNLPVKTQKPESIIQKSHSDSAEDREKLRDLRGSITGIFQRRGLPPLENGRAAVWLAQGYDPAIISSVIEDVLGRKKSGVGNLNYFDGAIAEAHAKRAPVIAPRGPSIETVMLASGRTAPKADLLKAISDWISEPASWQRVRYVYGMPPEHPECEIPREFWPKREVAA